MMNIFKSISSKIDSQNENGNIMEEALNITKSMKGNPLFSSMVSNLTGGSKEGGGNILQGMTGIDPGVLANENRNNRQIKLNNPYVTKCKVSLQIKVN